jgi:hypothetical protein
MRIDASLARGAARSALRAADRETQHRLAASLRQSGRCDPVRDERTAKRFLTDVKSVYNDRIVMTRLELAKRHSQVIAFGFDGVEGDGRVEFCSFLIRSHKGNTVPTLWGPQFSHHAIERFQQRQNGVLVDLKPLVAEFAPALLAFIAARTKKVSPAEEGLLPTISGALITVYNKEADEECAVTWLSNDQLRSAQLKERMSGMMDAASLIEVMRSMLRRNRFAGRKDTVLVDIREDLESAIRKTIQQAHAREGGCDGHPDS